MNIGTTINDDRKPFTIDTQKFLTGTTALVAGSGYGKSNLVRVICQELCKERENERDSKWNFLVVDWERDYIKLKDWYRVILVATDGSHNKRDFSDIKWNDSSIDWARLGKVAPHVWPLILDVSEARKNEDLQENLNRLMKGLFAEEMYLKSPYLVILDEVDLSAVPLARIIRDFLARGRKRNLGLMVCTQGITKDVKEIIEPCESKIIGHLGEPQKDAIRGLFNKPYGGFADMCPELEKGEFFFSGKFCESEVPQKVKVGSWKRPEVSKLYAKEMTKERGEMVIEVKEKSANKVRTAVILAGGRGLRMLPEIKKPKALIEIRNKPVIFWVLKWLKEHGMRIVVIGVAFEKRRLINYLNRNSDVKSLGLKIKISRHKEEDETGGAFKRAINHVSDEDFVAMNGDELTNLNLRNLISFHLRFGQLATIAVSHMQSPYGVVRFNESKIITSFQEKPLLNSRGHPFVSAGVYVFNQKILHYLRWKSSIEVKTFTELGHLGKLKAYPLEEGKESWMTVNTMKDVERAEKELEDWGWGGGKGSKFVENLADRSDRFHRGHSSLKTKVSA